MSKRPLKNKSKHKKLDKKVAAQGQRGKAGSKTQACLALLKQPSGASIEDLQRATGWQPHSVRGFLSGKVRKIPDLELSSTKTADGLRRYYVKSA